MEISNSNIINNNVNNNVNNNNVNNNFINNNINNNVINTNNVINNYPLSTINPYLKTENFKDKHVIITGSAGAIGSSVLIKLLQCGSKVVGFYHKTIPNSSQLIPYINNKSLIFLQLDFEKVSLKITEKFKEAITFLGGILDILIFCHGKYFKGDFRTARTLDLDQNYKINVRANFHFLSLAVPFLKITRGNVVMMSSMESKIVENGNFLHALAKSMINSLIQNSALELASFGIRINGVAPSFVESDFRNKTLTDNTARIYLQQMKGYHLLNKQFQTPDEIANIIIFLASKEAEFMTGEIIYIDSGYELNHDTSFMQKYKIPIQNKNNNKNHQYQGSYIINNNNK